MKKTSIKDLSQILRMAGFKVTPIRLAVLSLFHTSRQPLSPNEVIESLGAQADQATLYRILKAFEKSGIIHHIDLRHNHPHYELKSFRDHHHITCTKCGRMEDIDVCMAQDLVGYIMKKSQTFSQVTDHSFELFGTCIRCTPKNI